MPRFNPDFWEILVPSTYLHQFCNEDQLQYESPEHRELQIERQAEKQSVLAQIREIIGEELTAIQRNCVMLHFCEGQTQEQIASTLGISRRVVSQHLFGVKRHGSMLAVQSTRFAKFAQNGEYGYKLLFLASSTIREFNLIDVMDFWVKSVCV